MCCGAQISLGRHVALLQIQGKEFELEPIPLRTVRPFVLEEVILSEASDEEGFDLNDQIAVSKFLKSRVCILPLMAATETDGGCVG
jgi:double-strand break repair protein MRE11